MEQYPSVESLSLFLKVVEAGSFTKVSRQNRIPKATLSRKITSLEEYYGTQLLIRNTRHLQLTEIGREIHNKAHSILAIINETEASVLKTKEKPNGLLRITAGVEYGLSVVSPLVNSFLKKYPEVNIELDLTGRKVDLIYENFDLAIRIGPLEDSTFSMRKINSFRYGLFVGKKFLNENKLITINNLATLPTLAFTRANGRNNWILINKLEEKKVEIIPRLSSNNYWTLLNAAKENIGIVYLPVFLAKEEIKKGNIVPILSEWCSEEIPVNFIYPSQKYLSSKVRHFIDFVISQT